MNNHESDPDIVAETENFVVWRSEEEDSFIYHIELGGISLHLVPEEWDELVLLIKSVR